MATATATGRQTGAGLVAGDEAPEPRRVLIGGSVRSGKSAFALALARRLGERRAFVATARALDDREMAERIERHRVERGADFFTVEEPLALVSAIGALTRFDVVVVDCLTLWMANLLLDGADAPQILAHVDDLASALRSAPFHWVLVTNEVGMGIVPETAMGRIFRDVCGRAHCRLASDAGEVYMAMLGVMLRLRPEPVTACSLAGSQ
jgi:adenosylcobinamide kinase/adenosylcobinamide-phosphate guanylyltransferase